MRSNRAQAALASSPLREIALAVLATGLLCLPFCATPATALGARDNPMEAPEVKQGGETFQQNCAACHGATARGGEAPSLIDSYLVRHDENGNLITSVVQNGRPERGMPAFPSLTAAQINNLAAFLHARIIVTSSNTAIGPVGGYELKALLTGDAAAGQHYFETTGKCASCHSAHGDLAGIATKYPPGELEARFLAPHKVTVTATVTAKTPQQTFHGKLLHHDPFYVAILDDSGNYRSWPADNVKVEIHDPLEAHRELLARYTNKDVHDVFAYLETLK